MQRDGIEWEKINLIGQDVMTSKEISDFLRLTVNI